jgi:two-component system, sensor histidine kinase PdtaS
MKKQLLIIGLFCICCVHNVLRGQDDIRARYTHITDSLVLYDTLFFYYRYANVSESMQYGQRGLELAEGKGDTNYIARFSTLIGVAYKNISKYDSAIFYYDKAILIDSIKSNKIALSGHIANKGFVYKMKGEYVAALTAYFRALELMGNENPKMKITVLNNIGNVYADQLDHKQALIYYQQAKILAEENNIQNAIAYAYNNIGNVFFAQAQYDKALANFDTSLVIKRAINDSRGIASSLGNIGRIYLAQEQLDSAQYYFEASQSLYNKIKEQSGEAEAYLYLGDVAAAKKNDAQAVMFYEKCLITSQAIGTKPIKLHVYKQLSTYYANQKQYEKAFIYASDYNNLRDSLQTIEHIKQINNIQHQAQQKDNMRAIEALQQRNQIQELQNIQQRNLQYLLFGGLSLATALLVLAAFFYRSKQKHNVVLAQKNVEISAALSHRELLLREIHHRVKNNLQIVASLLNLQRGNQHSPEEILQQSQERVHTMSILHELLYQSDQLDAIELGDYIQSLFNQLRQAYQKAQQINITINIQPIQFNIDRLTPCGLILNEIITNAFKYAFPPAANIADPSIHIIGSRIDEQQYKLSISDNGIGLPEGFDIKRSRSLGLRLVQGLCKQMNAQLVIHPQQPTSFDIIIQL